MVASNGFPSQTTTGLGLFNGASSFGLIQGQAFPDAATRNFLQSGVVSQNETVPMWGGLGVYAALSPISSSGPKQPLGPVLGRATTYNSSPPAATDLVGFTVFDQAYNMLADPNNPVQSAGSGMSINWYPLGSRARIALAASTALVSLRGGIINQRVGWDFVNQELVPYSPGYSQTTITDAVWASTAGGQVDFTVSSDLTADVFPGDFITTAAIVNTGGASTGAFNGNWMVVSITSTDIVVAAPASATLGTYASGGHVNALAANGIGVDVLDIQPSGCMTVNDTGGLYTWNFSGAAAVVRLTGGTIA